MGALLLGGEKNKAGSWDGGHPSLQGGRVGVGVTLLSAEGQGAGVGHPPPCTKSVCWLRRGDALFARGQGFLGGEGDTSAFPTHTPHPETGRW